jgi:cytochrome c peroxidase
MSSGLTEPISGDLDRQLREILARHQFTGRVESTLEQRLGRPIDPAKAQLGRLLFFDKFVGLHGDNSCAGCHSPLNGFGDSQSIAMELRTMILSVPGARAREINGGHLRW